MKQLADFIRSCPRCEGVDAILLPGDPERRLMAQRRANGIYLDDENWHQLTSLATRLEVDTPPV